MGTRTFACSLAIAVAALSNECAAFGSHGHAAIGAIADLQLAGTAAGQRVAALLRPGESLEAVAVWADCAKGTAVEDGRFKWRPNANFPECTRFDADAVEFERFVRANWTQCGTASGREYCHQQYHYTDVALQRSRYLGPPQAGTRGHDIVHAIGACIAMLQDRPVPAPFVFADRREALMLLAHYLGDLHQPLHVGAAYLDERGGLVDPDLGAPVIASEAAGGNLLQDSGGAFHPDPSRGPPQSLHSQWDAIPDRLHVGAAGWPEVVAAASGVEKSPEEVLSWPTLWATESLQQARSAFAGLAFQWDKNARRWSLTGADDAFRQRAEAIQSRQLARAGARLAQLLDALLKP